MREVSEGEAVRQRALELFEAYGRGYMDGNRPRPLDEWGDLWRAAVRAAETEAGEDVISGR